MLYHTFFLNTSQTFKCDTFLPLFASYRKNFELIPFEYRLDQLEECADEIISVIEKDETITERYDLIIYAELEKTESDMQKAEVVLMDYFISNTLLSQLRKKGRRPQSVSLILGVDGDDITPKINNVVAHFLKYTPIGSLEDLTKIAEEVRVDAASLDDEPKHNEIEKILRSKLPDKFEKSEEIPEIAYLRSALSRNSDLLNMLLNMIAGVLADQICKNVHSTLTEEIVANNLRPIFADYIDRSENRKDNETDITRCPLRRRDSDYNVLLQTITDTLLHVLYASDTHKSLTKIKPIVTDEKGGTGIKDEGKLFTKLLVYRKHILQYVLDNKLIAEDRKFAKFNDELYNPNGKQEVLAEVKQIPESMTQVKEKKTDSFSMLSVEKSTTDIMNKIRQSMDKEQTEYEDVQSDMIFSYYENYHKLGEEEFKEEYLLHEPSEEKAEDATSDWYVKDTAYYGMAVRKMIHEAEKAILEHESNEEFEGSFEDTYTSYKKKIDYELRAFKKSKLTVVIIALFICAFGLFHALIQPDVFHSFGGIVTLIATFALSGLALYLGNLIFARRQAKKIRHLCYELQAEFRTHREKRIEELRKHRRLLAHDLPLCYILKKHQEDFEDYVSEMRRTEACITYHKDFLRRFIDFIENNMLSDLLLKEYFSADIAEWEEDIKQQLELPSIIADDDFLKMLKDVKETNEFNLTADIYNNNKFYTIVPKGYINQIVKGDNK